VNRGYDEALNSGFARAAQLGCEYVITMDADGQHDPAILAAFIEELDGGADVVIGVRDRRQRLAEHVFSWVGAACWGIRDPLCGVKAYRTGLYREWGDCDSFNSIGTDLALYAARTRRRIAQLVVTTRERHDRPRFGTRYSANRRILWALWRSLLRVSGTRG
jgi:glycosyltransferase involved in cell wall biosynthesis